MKKWIFLIAAVVVISCKEKKVDLSGERPVKINDFIAAFPVLSLPFTAADTNFTKFADTVVIGYKAFVQFIPDSALHTTSASSHNITIHPVGKIEKEKEIYLLATISSHKKNELTVFVLNKKYNYLSSKTLLSNINNDDYSHSVNINKEPTFLISQEKTNSDKQLLFTRIGWVYNNKNFMVVINDGNEDPAKTAIIDPIDTLSKKNKYSGNYIINNRNFVSVRDGKNLNTYSFFIHFEKNEGACTGELKGILQLKTATKGIYQENGDPCVIDFIFTKNELTVKEKGSCGNRRGMNCFFDDTYTKRKEIKSIHKK